MLVLHLHQVGQETRTLRRRLTRLAAQHCAEQLGAELARVRVEQRGHLMGFLYVDGHVRAYHGERQISSNACVARRHLKSGFDVLTYRKGPCRRINERRFIRRRAKLDGRWVDYLLHDQPVRFLNYAEHTTMWSTPDIDLRSAVLSTSLCSEPTS